MEKQLLINLLMDKPVAYHADIAKAIGSVNAGLFVSQLMYWTGKEKSQDGFIYKTQAEWYDELGMGRREQETARKKLKSLGILEEKLVGLPAKLHYKIHFDALIQVLKKYYDSLKENPRTPDNPSMAENAKLERRKVPYRKGGKRHTGEAENDKHTITENTTENTTENNNNKEKNVVVVIQDDKFENNIKKVIVAAKDLDIPMDESLAIELLKKASGDIEKLKNAIKAVAQWSRSMSKKKEVVENWAGVLIEAVVKNWQPGPATNKLNSNSFFHKHKKNLEKLYEL